MNNITYGLSNTDIESVVALLKKNKKLNKIILFGSRAKGTFKNGSDIDLALVGDALNLDDVLNYKVELDELFLPYQFDLVIYNSIKEPALLEHIASVGITLFSMDSQ